MDKVKKSVLVPIIFFSWFGFPLTLRELRRYLWQHELTEDEIEAIVRDLPGVVYRGGLIWLGEAVSDRVELERRALRLWRQVQRWRWVFANIPFLRLVFVSNTLSYNNVRAGSDIDLFIVTQADRAWTARAWLLVWMNLFNLRVRSVNRASKFSPEFFVTETSWNLQAIAIPDDYYLSFWAADLVPIWPGREAAAFRQANRWLVRDLPIAWRSPRQVSYPSMRTSVFASTVEWCLRGSWGHRLEQSLRRYQSAIIRRNLTRLGVNPQVITDANTIKLHFNDRRGEVREAINRSLHEILG